MTDDLNAESNVNDEVVPPVEDQTHIEDSDNQNRSQETEKEDENAKSWREVRQQMKEQKRMLRAQQAEIERLSKPPAPIEPDEFESVDESEYLNAGKTRKMIAREAERIAKANVESILAEREKSRFHERLKSKFSDFDDVVNAESLALLDENEPELAEAISQVKDPYKQGLQCYKMLKNSDLLDKLPNRRRSKETEKKLKENENKLPSPSAFENRPMAQAFTMGENPSKLYDEMQRYAAMAPGI